MVCVTALPCRILIVSFAISLYMFITINDNKYNKICTLDTIHVKKQHIEMLSLVINDLLLHKCPLLSRTVSNQSLC